MIELRPKGQVVSEVTKLDWKPVGTDHCNNELCLVITMLLTVRNNLFHGGKHGDSDVDDKARNLKLLSLGNTVLDQLAESFNFANDYTRYY